MRLSGRIEIGGQEHFYLEGQAALAIPGEDRDVTLHCSTQHPPKSSTGCRMSGVPSHAVTVETRRMGSAFGGKETGARRRCWRWRRTGPAARRNRL